MRLRFRFAKQGKVRWLSHRDLARVWERGLRRAELPVAYTEGFSPRPKLHFGLALPTGADSAAEYLDVDLDPVKSAGLDVATLPARLSPLLPVGIDVLAATVLEGRGESLQQAVTSTVWEFDVTGLDPEEAHRRVDALVSAPSLVVTRERKGKQVTDDLRPAVLSLAVAGPTDDGVRLECELATRERGVRPSELLAALGIDVGDARVRRTSQWIERAGAAREDPLPLDAPGPPRVDVGRAS